MSLTPLPTKLQPADLLRIFQVPGYQNVFHLPIAESPQRIISQQRRALNLVYSLRAQLARSPRTRAPVRDLAVIGGGFGGITAAIYAASFGFTVTLFEKDDRLLRRFENSTRWIFPHLHDWPKPTWEIEEAMLPVASWRAGEAQLVRKQVWNDFQWCQQIYGEATLQVEYSQFAKPISPSHDRVYVLSSSTIPSSAPPQTKPFRAVILATGFGTERGPEAGNGLPSYWDTGEVGVDEALPLVVSGLGDGGLADLIRAFGISDADLPQKLRDITEQIGTAAMRELQRFEDNIGVLRSVLPDADLSRPISAHYMTALKHVYLPTTTSLPLRIVLVGDGRHAEAFREGTYPANRSIAISLLNGHRASGREYYFLPGPVEISLRTAWAEKEEQHYPCPTFATFPSTSGELPDVLECRAIVRNGPVSDPIERVIGRSAVSHLRNKTAFFDLSLTERPLFPSPLGPTYFAGRNLPQIPSTRRMRVYSEFYDSYIQRNLIQQIGSVATRETLIGRLRLHALLFDEIILTDSMALDGAAFAEIAEHLPEELAFLSPSIHVRARETTLETALLSFLGARAERRPPRVQTIPEVSLVPEDYRERLRHDLYEAFRNARSWPIKSLDQLKGLLGRDGLFPWSELLSKWDAVISAFSQASHTTWKRRIFSPTPLSTPPLERGLKIDTLRHVVARFRESRTQVFEGLNIPADQLLREPATARIVEWYNSAYNEAIAKRQRATVFESFWIPDQMIKDRHSETSQGVGVSYRHIGTYPVDLWQRLVHQFRPNVLMWRSGRFRLDVLLSQINEKCGYRPSGTTSTGSSFPDRLSCYVGELQIREQISTIHGGGGVRQIRCLLEGPQGAAPSASTRLGGLG